MTVPMIVIGLLTAGMMLFLGIAPILAERRYMIALRQQYENQYSHQELQARYEQLLQSILDLDADYDMGKVSAGVYAEQRKMLIGRSVYFRSQLDQSLASGGMDQRIEAVIKQRRQERAADLDRAIESQVSDRRQKVGG